VAVFLLYNQTYLNIYERLKKRKITEKASKKCAPEDLFTCKWWRHTRKSGKHWLRFFITLDRPLYRAICPANV